MYKKNTHLEKSKHKTHWLKRKIFIIITAFMLGFSNAINEEDSSLFENKYSIEQRDKK